MSRIRQIRIDSYDQAAARIANEVHRFPVRIRDTGGRLTISLVELPASQESRSLRHTAEDVLYCVIGGLLEFECAMASETLGPGDVAYVPRNCNFRTRPISSTKVLVGFAPGAMQEAFIAMGSSPQPLAQVDVANELAVWDVAIDERQSELTSVRQPIIVRADEGERYWLAGDEYTIKISGGMTGDRFCVVHFRIPPRGRTTRAHAFA